ncbi:uncharacterized protein BYT42DRAFT_604989 [Radiomyces spectabilis]|uniref:uncharacterized protein n=1 Tax=Radiomyces spectabilis TaxID=64574 RepID=UPI00221E8B97|nr:uncharacterized protein BYT42DRAFT_604989 [Radiomyces spectabilis]KAI8379680.1 hypothetical protein BYT42DRAFT_604989 [Radiomyces spectabilis]
MGGVNNINKVKGACIEKKRRMDKRRSKARHGAIAPAVLTVKTMSKKKQKQYEKALRNERRLLASKGIIQLEEEMTDVVDEPAKKRFVTVEIAPEMLAAAAAGPGTVLGAPQ